MQLFSDSTRIEDPYLRHAAELALRGCGTTAPNPIVGCVVVRDDVIVGEGFHPRAGAPHAEVFALADAGELAAGSDVYVTLEPCNHHGRTPPCSEALIAAGVARVVIGMPDPTPQARGGAETLREAGIAVEFAANPAPFAELNEGWLKRSAVGLPLVTAKVGVSLDGRISLEPGRRSSMTGSSGRRVTRRLRSCSDAVMVGASTVLVDDPALTVRDAAGVLAEHQPLRVVLVRSQCPHADARVFTDGAAPTLVFAGPDVDDGCLDRLGEEVIVERLAGADLLREALEALGRRGVNDVLVEPGSKLFESLWRSSAIDRLVVVSAGGVAGREGVAMSAARGTVEARESGANEAISGAHGGEGSALVRRMHPYEAGIIGDVAVTVWRPAPGGHDKE